MKAIGVLTLFGLVLCGAVHGFSEADFDELSRVLKQSTRALLDTAERSLHTGGGSPKELPGETQRFRPFGRTILQGGETVCVWSKEECTLSYEEFKTAFGSGDQQSVYIKADLECGNYTRGPCSRERERCTWDSGSCYSSASSHPKINGCDVDSKALLRLGETQRDCFLKGKIDCDSNTNCVWDGKNCGADVWKLFLQPLGAADPPGKRYKEIFDEALEKGIEQLRTKVTTSRSLDTILMDDCNKDPQPCGFIKTILETTYNENSECRQLVRNTCAGNCTLGVKDCTLISERRNKIIEDGFKQLVEGAQISEGARQHVQKVFKCSSIGVKATCDEEDDECYWGNNGCSIDQSLIFTQLAEEAKKLAEDNILCKYAASFWGNSHCLIQDRKDCRSDERCSWNRGRGMCENSPKESWKTFVEGDAGFTIVQGKWDDCKAARTEDDCIKIN